MNRRSVATNGQCGQLSEKVSTDKNRQGPGHVPARLSQEPRERSSSTAFVSEATPRSHQRRWSDDFCRCGTSPVITVKKDKKVPQPPQRGVSLLRLPAASRPPSKRYSCPPIGVFGSSSSSSSSTSSCSSPPPVQTSVITGHDPLGWKLRPKSSSKSPRAPTNRLSLQIPLPVVIHEPESRPATDSRPVLNANPDPSRENKPPFGPKTTRRRHSDSSAFLKSLAPPMPAVTLEELRHIHLRPLALLDESDDVFGRGNEEEAGVTAWPRKIPPPVPEKTPMARQIAQMMTHSHQRRGPFTANEEIIYSSVIKPIARRSHQTEDHSGLNARVTGLRVDTSCDRERSTPRFPG